LSVQRHALRQRNAALAKRVAFQWCSVSSRCRSAQLGTHHVDTAFFSRCDRRREAICRFDPLTVFFDFSPYLPGNSMRFAPICLP
jgi:hypothetical protein